MLQRRRVKDQSRRPIIAMDYFFMKMESAPSVQAISEESITYVAVKEDRHQNIMSSVALKKGVEEPLDNRESREIHLFAWLSRNHVEELHRACDNRVQKSCCCNVQSRSYHGGRSERRQKSRRESNGLIENAVMLLRGIIRTIKCHIESRTQEPLSDDSLVIPRLVEHAGCILSRCQKGRDGRKPFERLHGKKPTQEFVPFGEKVLAGQVTTEPRNRMNPRYQYAEYGLE